MISDETVRVNSLEKMQKPPSFPYEPYDSIKCRAIAIKVTNECECSFVTWPTLGRHFKKSATLFYL